MGAVPPPCTLIKAGDLSAIVGDDTPRGPGGRQYSGLWSLIHVDCQCNPFQGANSGLLAGPHRGSGPALELIDETSARLVRSPWVKRPYRETRGTYTLTPPHYVDYTYEVEYRTDVKFEKDSEFHGWCCYMNSPMDPSIHFIEDNIWTTLMPVVHGEAAMVFPSGLSDARRLESEKVTGEARFAKQRGFADSFSGKSFDHPFYYGVIHGMIFLIMADHHEDFRFFISPSGGGYSAVPGGTSPAWDFAWIIWNPVPGETRTLHLRVAYFPAAGGDVPQRVWSEWETFRSLHPVK